MSFTVIFMSEISDPSAGARRAAFTAAVTTSAGDVLAPVVLLTAALIDCTTVESEAELSSHAAMMAVCILDTSAFAAYNAAFATSMMSYTACATPSMRRKPSVVDSR